MPPSGFPYKKVLVIGATSGIGEALAAKLVDQGKKVVVVGRRQEKLDEFVKTHGQDKASAMAFDITKLDKIPAWASSVTDAHPDLDCVLINSGIQRGFDFSAPATVDLSVVSDEFTTNYLSFLHLANAFLPHLQSLSRSSSPSPAALVFTTSGLALVPMTRCPNYCASKAALHAYIMVLREQLKDGDGDVNVVELLPPAVQTELHDAKHQPDIKNGGQIGIPLKEYIEETWKGLSEGKESVPVGSAKTAFEPDGFETKRRQAFQGSLKQLKEMMKKQQDN